MLVEVSIATWSKILLQYSAFDLSATLPSNPGHADAGAVAGGVADSIGFVVTIVAGSWLLSRSRN